MVEGTQTGTECWKKGLLFNTGRRWRGGRGLGRYREEARKDMCDDRLDQRKVKFKEMNQVKKLPDTWLNHFPAMASSVFPSFLAGSHLTEAVVELDLGVLDLQFGNCPS